MRRPHRSCPAHVQLYTNTAKRVYLYQTHLESGSDKKWSKPFPPIAIINIHTRTLDPNHNKPIDFEVSHNDTVVIGYSVGQPVNRRHLVIGEFKRCLITAAQWQAGRAIITPICTT
ncbi:hypothetical protein BM221_008520 [Beauveria bassiana]|uniref:Uncharacterized protein n=1 Tax=Beauveria bassiana TaxID=176275 RepID=A0A2N6NCZ5_BEABA|nr:hypothetical protein BM221_008520 [Beauveria bassiana]